MLGLLSEPSVSDRKIRKYKNEFREYMKMNPKEFEGLTKEQIEKKKLDYIKECITRDFG